MLRGSLILRFNEYTPEVKAKMGRFGTECGLAKAARHFPQFLDGKLHEAYVVVVVFWSRDRIAKLKIRHI